MRGDEVLKVLLRLSLAGGEALTALLPSDLRREARKTAAELLRLAAEIALSFAERAEGARDIDGADDSLRGVHIE